MNLASVNLTNVEEQIVKLGLNFGNSLRLKEPQLIAAVEAVWDQINRLNFAKGKKTLSQGLKLRYVL